MYKTKNKHLFNGLFSRTTWVSQHQKGKTILDFNEARDDDVAVASAGPYANHLHFGQDRQPCQYLITGYFTGQMLFLMLNNSVKALKAKNKTWKDDIL